MSLLIVVAVDAAFTWCGAVPFEAAKFAEPAYVALSVFAPAVVEVRLHDPVPPASVTVQLAEPSDTFTVPAGVPAPGACAATVTFTAYG